MKISITQTATDKAIPKTKPYEIRDTRLTGFLIRVQPSGRKTYYCEYRRGARIKIGQFQALSVKMARDRAKEILADYYHGGEPAIEMKRKKSASTYKQYLEEHYFSWVDANHSSAQHTRRRLIVDCAQFLNKKLTLEGLPGQSAGASARSAARSNATVSHGNTVLVDMYP